MELAYQAYGIKEVDTDCKNPGRFSRYPNGTNAKGIRQDFLKAGSRVDNLDFLEWAKGIVGVKEYIRILYGKDNRPIKPVKIKLWMSPATKDLIESGITKETSRHGAFVKAVAQLKHSGYEDDSIYELLEGRFHEMIPERNIKELKHIIKWARKYNLRRFKMRKVYVVIMQHKYKEEPRMTLGLYKTLERAIKEGIKEERRCKGIYEYDVEIWPINKNVNRTFGFEFELLKERLTK